MNQEHRRASFVSGVVVFLTLGFVLAIFPVLFFPESFRRVATISQLLEALLAVPALGSMLYVLWARSSPPVAGLAVRYCLSACAYWGGVTLGACAL